MELNTASAVVSFAKDLEDKSRQLYEEVSKKYLKEKGVFLSFADENKKNRDHIVRVYYSVISDAMEGCFSFEGMDTKNYEFEAQLPDKVSLSDAVRMAAAMEDKIAKFYVKAAKTSKSLLADIPETFEKLARKRKERILKLKSLLNRDRDGSK
jgi:hypothetical protein